MNILIEIQFTLLILYQLLELKQCVRVFQVSLNSIDIPESNHKLSIDRPSDLYLSAVRDAQPDKKV